MAIHQLAVLSEFKTLANFEGLGNFLEGSFTTV